MIKTDRPLLIAFLSLLAVALAPLAALAILGDFDRPSDARTAAVLTFAGVLLTALTSVIGILSRRRSEDRLRLEAAMQAGQLINASDGRPPDSAAVAAGLLALTNLERADLAVALLVDLWDAAKSKRRAGESGIDTLATAVNGHGRQSVSNETAILILDEALRGDARTQLVAAEVLCRNAAGLDICQSLHWPQSLDDGWNESFGVRTKVLLVEALLQMAQAHDANQSSLQWLTVRLYTISARDHDPYVKGCIGTLLTALLPALERTNVKSLMVGPHEKPIDEIRSAAAHEQMHEDRVFVKLADQYAQELGKWSIRCEAPRVTPGALAAAVVSGSSKPRS